VDVEKFCKNYEYREVDDGADTADAGIFKNIHLLVVGSSVLLHVKLRLMGKTVLQQTLAHKPIGLTVILSL
jgi:hypothetical protein